MWDMPPQPLHVPHTFLCSGQYIVQDDWAVVTQVPMWSGFVWVLLCTGHLALSWTCNPQATSCCTASTLSSSLFPLLVLSSYPFESIPPLGPESVHFSFTLLPFAICLFPSIPHNLYALASYTLFLSQICTPQSLHLNPLDFST